MRTSLSFLFTNNVYQLFMKFSNDIFIFPFLTQGNVFQVKKTGLDAFGIFGDSILYGVNDFVSEKLVNKNNFFGNAFLNKINKVWYGNLTVYNTLVKWCKDRNVPMQLYWWTKTTHLSVIIYPIFLNFLCKKI